MGIKSSEEPYIKFNFPETFSSKSTGAKLIYFLGAVTYAQQKQNVLSIPSNIEAMNAL